MLIFSRLFELATNKILDNGPRSSITARLVVPTSQIGCVLGKGGVIVSEMRKTTGAAIQILKVEQNPKCISENDQVVQVLRSFVDLMVMVHIPRDNLSSDL
jgi:poly(rC)-binding protein 2/3/4